MTKQEELLAKIEKLRQEYRTAKLEDRRLLEIRANIYKRVLANYQSKNGFIA